MTRVLDARNVQLREELTLHGDIPGARFIKRGGVYLCGEDLDTFARAARFAIDVGPLTGRTVAWIGGGLCVGPRVFAIASCVQVVYEIEQSFAEFCPGGVKFIGGDWRDTIGGRFDVIIYDLGGDVPRESLTPHLNPGGIILPIED